MKYRNITLTSALFLAILVMPWIAVFAQHTSEVETPDIVQRIVEEPGSNVEIEVSDELLEKILAAPTSNRQRPATTTQTTRRPGLHKQEGYRVQIFNDGRNQSTLRARAQARGNAVAGRFPKYRGQIYTFSQSPNWFTRVGNFRSQSEATAAMAELKRAFPAFAGEMRVVRSQIVLIK